LTIAFLIDLKNR